ELNSVRSLAGWWLENDLLEFRSPYCDYDLMQFSLTVPSEQKLVMGLGRELWRREFPALGKIEYQRTGLPLTASVSRIILKRLKDQMRGATRPPGILDYETAFRNQMADWLKEMLCHDSSRVSALLNAEMVSQTVNDHLSGTMDNTLQLGLLLTLEQVLRLTEEF
ncbi:MAG: asparagine synthase-related protein, partial [bacterium]